MSKSKLSVYLSGKVTDEDYARHDDAKRAFLTQAVEMKWWQDENMWDKSAFEDAKTFLKPNSSTTSRALFLQRPYNGKVKTTL